jgi:hypothetical protein
MVIFGCLSVADFLLTWWLLERSRTGAYEGNPLARWCLLKYGWTGLAAFKSVLVVVFGALALVVFRARRRAAERLMTFACVTLAAVVFYSGSLLAMSPRARAAPKEDKSADAPPPEWAEEMRRNVTHARFLDGLCEDLIAGRRTLDEAVDVLAETPRARQTRWLRQLASTYDCDSARKCLAAYLLTHAEGYCRDVHPLQFRAIAPRLRAAFHAEHGPLPSSVVNLLPPLTGERADRGRDGGRGDRASILLASPPARG